MSDVDSFCAAFCAATGTDPGARHDVWAFGDSPALADDLLAQVLAGTKRATADLLVLTERADYPVPMAGAYSVVLDGSGAPRCVLHTTDVRIVPFRDVDAAFARDEGEGPGAERGTLTWWRTAHERYFRRALAAHGLEFDEGLDCVCERFDLAWTP